MGNVIESLASGFAKSIGKLFGSNLDFLTGKSCSTICKSPWDFFCYIEHFCLVNLLKMAFVAVILYIVLLFLYLLYKLRICQCVGNSLCSMVWSCFSCCFSSCGFCYCFLCHKLPQQRRRRKTEEIDSSIGDLFYRGSSFENNSDVLYDAESSIVSRRRHHRGVHLRKTLRPRSHRSVVISSTERQGRHRQRSSLKYDAHDHRDGGGALSVHGIRVVRESKFSRKGSSFRAVVDRSHRRRKFSSTKDNGYIYR